MQANFVAVSLRWPVIALQKAAYDDDAGFSGSTNHANLRFENGQTSKPCF